MINRLACMAAVSMLIGGVAYSGAAADELKFGFITKMGDHPWFVREVAGARETAESLGVNMLSQDVQFDANLTVTTFETFAGDGVTAVAIAIPDRALGPSIYSLAEKHGIALVSVDDNIEGPNGEVVPYVGMDAASIGRQVGTEIAKLVKAQGWTDDLGTVKVASIEDQKAESCMRRNHGARDGLLAMIPELEPNIISVPYDNTMVNAIDVISTTLIANPGASRWIFYSCNDDGVLGAVRATENSGIPSEDVIGIGIDGSRTCEAYAEDMSTGFRGTMWLDAANHGAIAIKALYSHVAEGKPFQDNYFADAVFINPDNLEAYSELLGCQ